MTDSDFVRVIDAVLDDIRSNISQLAGTDVVVHRYASWDPEELREDGQRHLACWPDPEAEVANPEVNDGHQLSQSYILLYWEPSPEEGERDVSNEPAAKSFLNLHGAIKDRFFVEDNETKSGTAARVWYQASLFGDRPGAVRWFAMSFVAVQFKAFV